MSKEYIWWMLSYVKVTWNIFQLKHPNYTMILGPQLGPQLQLVTVVVMVLVVVEEEEDFGQNYL